MKKSRFLVLALAVCIMVLGAGYAAWTESVNIDNTVVTGNLSVALADGTVQLDDGLTRTATAKLDTTAADKNVATVNITKLYPGAHVIVTIPITNDGNIPVINNGLTTSNVPTWLTVSGTAPASLAVGASGSIVYTIDVANNTPDTTPEGASATFDVGAIYNQFR